MFLTSEQVRSDQHEPREVKTSRSTHARSARVLTSVKKPAGAYPAAILSDFLANEGPCGHFGEGDDSANLILTQIDIKC